MIGTGILHCSILPLQNDYWRLFNVFLLADADIILPTADFTPQAANPIAVKGISATLKFDLKIKNNALAGNDITAANPNYAVDFYFSYSNNADQSIITKQLIPLSGTSPALGFPLNGQASSGTLTFQTTGTLPTSNCNSYRWLCGCVKPGTAATYTDTVTTNNCACKDASALIACDAGRCNVQIFVLSRLTPL
jgi:hypothetical protein